MVAGSFAACTIAACSLAWATALAAAQAPASESSVSVHIYGQTIVRVPAAPANVSPARPRPPPCRFDVVAVDGERLEWLRAAFDAS